MTAERQRLLLIDATNLGHRIFHAPSVRPIDERFGFSLGRWRKQVRPDYAVAVFDGPGEMWRHHLWPKYKAEADGDPSRRPSASDWAAMREQCAWAMPELYSFGAEAATR